MGEYAAACVAGAVDLPDALRLIALRGRLMESVRTPGAMLALPLGEEDALRAIGGRTDLVSLAAVNGPRDTVLSGAADAIEEIAAELAAEGVSGRRLAVSHAFHSPLLDPVLGAIQEAAATVEFHEPRIPVHSNLTGQPLDRATLADPSYWARHARLPVRFHEGLLALVGSGVGALIETGPGRTLLGLTARTLSDQDTDPVLRLPSLRRGSRRTPRSWTASATCSPGARRSTSPRCTLPTPPPRPPAHLRLPAPPPVLPARSANRSRRSGQHPEHPGPHPGPRR